MSITLATTTIRVERPAEVDLAGDPWGEGATAPLVLIASGVAAHLGGFGGTSTSDGEETRERRRLLCDPVNGLDHLCRVTDELTGKTYEVSWVNQVRASGTMAALNHDTGELVRISGQAE